MVGMVCYDWVHIDMAANKKRKGNFNIVGFGVMRLIEWKML
jgi:hypothetical protein